MIVFGKIAGGFLAYKIATFFEADKMAFIVGGILIGHVVDAIFHAKLEKIRAERYWKRKAEIESNRIFFQSIFAILGKLTVADGPVTPEEQAAVDKIMTEVLKLNRRAKKEAVALFRFAQVSPSSFQYEAARFYEVHQNQPQALENFLAMLFSVATADGKLKVSEETLIRSAAMLFNYPETSYIALRRSFTGESSAQSQSSRSYGTGNGSHRQQNASSSTEVFGKGDSYKVLGCSPSDPETVIKQKYRKLVAEYHPDKIVSKDLPEDFMKFASDKFKTIQEAYENIKAERKFN